MMEKRSKVKAHKSEAGSRKGNHWFVCSERAGALSNPDQERLGFIAAMPGMGAQDSQPAVVPTSFQVFPYGSVQIQGDEPFTVDDEAMNRVIEAFQARGLDMVIDYEHQTDGGEYASPDGTAPAAGWVKSLENRGGEGLWANVKWMPRATEFLKTGEYRYYSPVFAVSKEDRKLVRLLRLALTNAPRLDWIRPIVAKEKQHGGETYPPSRNQNPMERSQHMDKNLLILLAKKLGLPEASTQEEILARIGELQIAAQTSKPSEQVIAAKEVFDALGLAETASKSELVATIHALKQRPDLTQEVATLKAKLASRERDELVASALKVGKITPAQKEWAETYALNDPDGFKLFVAKAPQVVPTDDLHLVDNPKPKGDVPDNTQLQINKMCGISDETWKKYNP